MRNTLFNYLSSHLNPWLRSLKPILISGGLFVFIGSMLVWIALFFLNLLHGFWSPLLFDHLDLPSPVSKGEYFIFLIAELALTVLVVVIVGVLLRTTNSKLLRLRGLIPFSKHFTKNAENTESMTLTREELKELTPVMIPKYDGVSDTVSFVLNESSVTIRDSKKKILIKEKVLSVYTPNFPIIITGKFQIVQKCQTLRINNEFSEIVAYILSLGKKKVDWNWQLWDEDQEIPGWWIQRQQEKNEEMSDSP